MPKTKKIPLRKCTGCGEMKPKKELIRVLHTPEDTVIIDKTGKNEYHTDRSHVTDQFEEAESVFGILDGLPVLDVC